MPQPQLSVSAFAADVGYTAKDIALVHDAGVDCLHIDVMDGYFVTLTGLGESWLEAMRPHIRLPIDVHLMTMSPERFIPRLAPFEVASMTIHLEGRDLDENRDLLERIGRCGARKGLAISPDTPVSALFPYLESIDDILVMTTQPGEPGSMFIPESLDRIHAVRSLLDRARSRAGISVDGGLDLERARMCLRRGADKVVMGRAFFHHPHPASVAATVHEMKNVPLQQ